MGAAWATVDRLLDGFMALLPLLVIALLVFLLLMGLARLVRSLIQRAFSRSANASAAIAVSRLAYAGMLAIAALVSVTIAFPTMTPGRLFSVLGIGGVAIGFAFKDVLQNLLAGILILLRQPFKVGDEITTGGFTGKVEAIETRATFIRTYDGQRVIVPNSDVYTKPVIVISAYDMLRSEYDIGVGYSDDLGRAKQIALSALRSVPDVLEEPAPDVLVWDLAGSSKNLRVRWWTKPERPVVVRARDQVLQAVAEALANEGVDLPFPTQVLLLHDQTEETDGDRTRQREGWPAGDSPPKPRRRSSSPPERRGEL